MSQPDPETTQQVSDECIGGECVADWCRGCFSGCIHNGACIDCGCEQDADGNVTKNCQESADA